MSTRRPKIIHASTHYYPVNGGQQLYIDQLNSVFDGFEKIIIQLENGYKIDHPKNVISLTCPSILSYKGMQNYGYNYSLQRKIDELASEGVVDLDNDLFISHYAFHHTALKRAKKVIYISHGVEWDGPGGLFKKLYHLHRFLINKRLVRDPNVTIVANDCNYYRKMGFPVGVANYFQEIYCKKWLIPNCIDTAYFKPYKSFSPRFSNPTIVIPRNIVPQRGIDVVIKSFREVCDRYSAANLDLVVIGAPYDQSYLNTLTDMVERFGLKGRVKFPGSIPRNEMRDIYLSAELVVIFSTFREGTSLAALEAMSCGIPVITSNVGGLKDLPTVKSESYNLASKIIETLDTGKETGVRQQKWVTDKHDFSQWKTFWLNQLRTYGIK